MVYLDKPWRVSYQRLVNVSVTRSNFLPFSYRKHDSVKVIQINLYPAGYKTIFKDTIGLIRLHSLGFDIKNCFPISRKWHQVSTRRCFICDWRIQFVSKGDAKYNLTAKGYTQCIHKLQMTKHNYVSNCYHAHSIQSCHLTSKRNSIVDIRSSILVRWHLYIEPIPWYWTNPLVAWWGYQYHGPIDGNWMKTT